MSGDCRTKQIESSWSNIQYAFQLCEKSLLLSDSCGAEIETSQLYTEDTFVIRDSLTAQFIF